MRKLTILILLTFLFACSGTKHCPECPEKVPCIIYDTVRIEISVPVYDTIFVIYPGLEYYENLRDSMEFWAQYFINLEDSILNIGIRNQEELEKYFEEQNRKIDSTKQHWNNIFNRREDSLRLYALKLDSLKNTRIFNNLIIKSDSITGKARAEFDPETGKPVLIFE